MNRLTSLRIVPSDTDVEFEQPYPDKMEEIITGAGHQPIRLVTLQSPEHRINTLLPDAGKTGAAVLLRRRPTGFTQILVQHGLDAKLLYTLLKRLEHERNPDYAVAERTWYLHSCERIISNGMSPRPEIPPTMITLSELRYLVRLVIDPHAFDPQHAVDCLQGVCVATKSRPCRLYHLQLRKCTKLQENWTAQLEQQKREEAHASFM